MTDLVLREDINGIAWLTLNRADKMNALSIQLFTELENHLNAIAKQSDEVGCVVLKGAGKCFSAGMDLGEVGKGKPTPRPHFQAKVIEAISQLPQPVVIAVHGHCFTGALELALAGDIILASENALFADTHTKWALQPVWGMSQRLPRRVGRTKATEMMLTGKTYNASEALDMQLVNAVYTDDAFIAGVTRFCEDMIANSWHSLRGYKNLVNKTDGMSLAEGLSYEVFNSAGVGPDMKERLSGFGKK